MVITRLTRNQLYGFSRTVGSNPTSSAISRLSLHYLMQAFCVYEGVFRRGQILPGVCETISKRALVKALKMLKDNLKLIILVFS